MARTGRHLVVDGSNIATEGRTSPSLAQLDEAVQAIQAEHPEWTVTVIVDATFAHRIDTSERKTFEDASDNGEILMPPAGAVGRGDAFILQVAEKADAAVLSNDSFQEFHGTHTWLFDEGRLIGGKPVEGIGWIFVDRVPVRGPTSRRATREAAAKSGKSGRSSKKSGSKRASRSKASKEAQGPPPVPSSETPPPATKRRGRRSSSRGGGDRSDKTDKTDQADETTKSDKGDKADTGDRSPKRDRSATSGSGSRTSNRGGQREALNSPEDFLRFVTRYSIGEEAEAVVERFSSHGCYLRAVGAQCYLPVSAMGDPPPNRARDVVSQGQTAIVRVNSLDSDRRGINVELVRVVSDGSTQQNPSTGPSRRRGQSQTSQQPANVADDSAGEANPPRSDTTVATKKATKKSAKKATKKATRKAAKKSPAKKAAKKVTKKSPAKATASSRAAKATAKKATKKRATKKAAKKSPAKKAAKKTTKKAAKKSPAKKAAKKTTKKAAKRAPAKKAAKKTTKKAAKRSTAKKATKRS